MYVKTWREFDFTKTGLREFCLIHHEKSDFKVQHISVGSQS